MASSERQTCDGGSRAPGQRAAHSYSRDETAQTLSWNIERTTMSNADVVTQNEKDNSGLKSIYKIGMIAPMPVK